MQETSLSHLIRWGIGGAGVGAIPLLLVFASDRGLSGPLFIVPFIVVWGITAGLFAHYTWNTGAHFVACSLGVVACLLGSMELMVGGFFGAIGLSGAFLALLGIRYPSTLELMSGVTFAGVLYQAALLVVLLVVRQLFRWANALAARYRRSR